MSEIKQIFNEFLNAKPLFRNRNTLNISFTPEDIPHREDQINELAHILAPSLKGERPSNVFIYGRTGTGKSLVSGLVVKELSKSANGHKIKTIYVNCKLKKAADTEYRLLAVLAKEFGERVPFTGLPTDQIYNRFFKVLDKEEQVVIIIIDEIDTLIKKTGDEILYNLTRINEDLKKAKLCIVGITNELDFINNLDPRVKSSLSEEELIFPPYNAVQLQDILSQRARLAFAEGVLDAGVIEKCAALAAQEHGDARRALDLLRVAGELAERKGDKKTGIEHVDAAEERIDIDRVVQIVKTQPRQSQAVLYSIMQLGNKNIQTADIVSKYQDVCKKHGLKELTQRRISDLISELDLFGIINSKVISRGRHGRTRTINLSLDSGLFQRVFGLLSEVFY